MFFALIAAALAGLGGAVWWRGPWTASDPSRWPEHAGLDEQIRLTKRFLRKQGWTIGEPMPWMNVFVRGNRGKIWLNLMIHGPETLPLPTLMRDCIEKSRNTAVIVGLLTRSALPPDLRHDADRNGLFVITPDELVDVEAHIERAAARLRALKAAATSLVSADAGTSAAPAYDGASASPRIA